MLKKLKHITVSEENYEILRDLGHTSESMNDVITVILNNVLQMGDSCRDLPSTKTQVPHKYQMEVNPLAKLIEDTSIFKNSF